MERIKYFRIIMKYLKEVNYFFKKSPKRQKLPLNFCFRMWKKECKMLFLIIFSVISFLECFKLFSMVMRSHTLRRRLLRRCTLRKRSQRNQTLRTTSLRNQILRTMSQRNQTLRKNLKIQPNIAQSVIVQPNIAQKCYNASKLCVQM